MKTFIIAVLCVFLTGCGSLQISPYEQYSGEDASTITFSFPADYAFSSFGFKEAKNCTHRLQMHGTEGEARSPSLTNLIKPNDMLVISQLVSERAIFFFHCAFAIRFIPKSQVNYILYSKFTGKNYCENSLKTDKGESVNVEYFDGHFSGLYEESEYCNGIEFKESVTGEFESSKYQDGYVPRKLKRKQ